LLFTASTHSRDRTGEYALILAEPPVAQNTRSRVELFSAAARAQRDRLRSAQAAVLAELAQRKVRVTSAAQLLVNAVFVNATWETAAKLRAIPGVAHVVYMPPLRRHLNTAINLVNVPAAWNAVAGAANAGAGIKIGIIDTGIDQNHPGFQDSSLQPPAGFQKGDPNYTNSKVIVARSYVAMLNTGDPASSTPDDTTPRDRVGHGTAIAMIAAGVQNTGPAATIQGVAPKAFLGNYKIFGSPGINDFTLSAAIVAALTDAMSDGMDIVTLALGEGDMATYAPLDVDNANCGGACDVRAQAVENAVGNGLVVVASAGNDGNIGVLPGTLDSIHTPGTAPSAITVGASTNSHVLFQALHVTASNAPSSLRDVRALFGDGPHIGSPLAAPLIDVAQLQNDGLACSALPAGSLNGAIALVQRGTCVFSDKINNAQNAGAIGVIIYQVAGQDAIYSTLGAQDTGIPAVMIGYTDGQALKSFVDSNPGVTAAVDPTRTAVSAPANVVAAFSSRGPSIGNFGITPTFVVKPELVAVGAGIYTATQKLDPNGEAYDATGYTSVSGTSYAVGMVAGAAALAKQKNNALNTPGRLKSAVVNTATQDVTDNGGTARVNAAGAGKLSAGDAVNVAATVEPATLSFGNISTTTVSSNLTLKITNVSGSAATFSFALQPTIGESNASVQLSQASLTLPAGQSNSITVSLRGNRPAPGAYEGFVVITGPGPTLRVPYLYMAGSGTPVAIFPVINGEFIGAPNDTNWLIAFKLVDASGVPVTNASVQFQVVKGGGSIAQGDATTDRTGIAAALVNLGPQVGDQIFTATAGGMTVEFDGYARRFPAISSNGIVDAASFRTGAGFAPGSYISIFGTNLADATAANSTSSLPVSLADVSVSVDGGGLSLPGRLAYVSPGQVNVQIPWEFQGQSSVAMKVTVAYLQSAFYTVPLATYSPGVFGVRDQNFAIVTQSNPARRGQAVQIYANGLGPVSNQPATGDAGPAQPLAATSVTPNVTIGGAAAQVLFSGLAPGNVGLYQVNAIVPSGVAAGVQPLVISINGVASQAFNLPLQ